MICNLAVCLGKAQLVRCLFCEGYERNSVEKRKSCACVLEKAFDRVRRKVAEWALRKKGLPEVLVQAVMSLHEG